MKKKGYGVSGEEERGLQNNLVFSISSATPKWFFFFLKKYKMAPQTTSYCPPNYQLFVKWPPKVSKWHFSNLTSKNDVVLYFSSNLTVLTNGVAKMQLFGSL
jgi:hypothetical protein